MKKYNRQLSPERAKVWTERSPKYQQQNRKVAVVYYLCKNRQLEHPHFIEVPLSSPDGLYLRGIFFVISLLGFGFENECNLMCCCRCDCEA